MFVAHTIPRPDDAELLVDGRSSILFATLAGVSLALMTGGSHVLARGDRPAAVRSIAIRAFVLFLIGTLLWLTGSEIAIILDYYAVMFLLLLPFLFARTWVLATSTVALAIAAPAVAAGLPTAETEDASLASVTSDYLLTGYYPALVWLPFLLIGMLCARNDLTSTATRTGMIGGGLAVAALGYGAATVIPGVTAAAHTSSTAEVAGSGGVAVAVIGLLVTICDPVGVAATRIRPRRAEFAVAARRILRRVLHPLGSAGAMSLTVYTTQILILAVAVRVRDTSGAVEYPGWPLLIVLTTATLIGSTVWQGTLGRGPLERVLGWVSRQQRYPLLPPRWPLHP